MVQTDTKTGKIMEFVETASPVYTWDLSLINEKSPAPHEGAGHSQGERRLLVTREVGSTTQTGDRSQYKFSRLPSLAENLDSQEARFRLWFSSKSRTRAKFAAPPENQ